MTQHQKWPWDVEGKCLLFKPLCGPVSPYDLEEKRPRNFFLSPQMTLFQIFLSWESAFSSHLRPKQKSPCSRKVGIPLMQATWTLWPLSLSRDSPSLVTQFPKLGLIQGWKPWKKLFSVLKTTHKLKTDTLSTISSRGGEIYAPNLQKPPPNHSWCFQNAPS